LIWTALEAWVRQHAALSAARLARDKAATRLC
jgi:hypothetical protein